VSLWIRAVVRSNGLVQRSDSDSSCSKEVPVLMSSPMAGVDCSDEGGDASAVTDGDIGPDVDRSCLGPRSMWWGGYESQDVSTTRGPDIYIV